MEVCSPLLDQGTVQVYYVVSSDPLTSDLDLVSVSRGLWWFLVT